MSIPDSTDYEAIKAGYLYCYQCKRYLPRQYFSMDRHARKARQNKNKRCKACDAVKFKLWYIVNRDRILQKAKQRDRRKKRTVMEVAGTQHDLSSTIDGKSPVRVFYELMEERDNETE